MAAYAALHGTPAAPFLAVADTFFIASGGTEAALAMQRIYLAVNSATTEQEMDAAAGTIIAELSGPAADAILNALIWGAGRGIAKVGSRLEVDPNSLGMGGGNIRFREAAAKSWDWEHILDAHSENGATAKQRNKPDQVFTGYSETEIMGIGKRAWAGRKKLETQIDPTNGETRIRYRGYDPRTKTTVDFWYNLDTRNVETMYPIKS